MFVYLGFLLRNRKEKRKKERGKEMLSFCLTERPLPSFLRE
jgi:hypothetical protein